MSCYNRLPAGHSFIQTISIAPLRVLYHSEALPTTSRILYRSITPKRTNTYDNTYHNSVRIFTNANSAIYIYTVLLPKPTMQLVAKTSHEPRKEIEFCLKNVKKLKHTGYL